jgi:protein-tyrosine-phosphatase
VLEYFDGQIDLLIDEGECKYKQSSTVLKITQNSVEILRPGVISQETIEKSSKVQILLVCTGNTCRSPMAEGVTKKYISEKLGCKLDQLEKNGYKICSAGTMGLSGMPASPEAAAACADYGIDIRKHRSTGLSRELIEQSDIIYAMSLKHLNRVIDLDAEAEKKCVLLADNEDVPDPIGLGQEYYNRCLDMIEKAVKKRISELLL